MTVSDISVLGLIKDKLKWHQTRQRVLAENVANADMPGFRPSELTPMDPSKVRPKTAPVRLNVTNAAHIAGSGYAADPRFGPDQQRGWETTPDGNAVVLEEQMMKVTENQMDYQAATTLYARGLAMLRGAVRSA